MTRKLTLFRNVTKYSEEATGLRKKKKSNSFNSAKNNLDYIMWHASI